MKRAVGVLLATFVGCVLTSTTWAETLTQKVTLTYKPSSYSDGADGGGEFAVTGNAGLQQPLPGKTNDGRFQTFCLEHSETFNPGTAYFWTIDPYAVGGGAGKDGTNSDSLSSKTAYLYTQFWNGTLDLGGFAYDYTGGHRAESALALQRVIWVLEGEFKDLNAFTWSSMNDTQARANAWLAAANASTWTGIGGVRVLNLWSGTGATLNINDNHSFQTAYLAQSQLVMVPLPAAAATTLAGLGMLLAGVAIRRIRNRAA